MRSSQSHGSHSGNPFMQLNSLLWIILVVVLLCVTQAPTANARVRSQFPASNAFGHHAMFGTTLLFGSMLGLLVTISRGRRYIAPKAKVKTTTTALELGDGAPHAAKSTDRVSTRVSLSCGHALFVFVIVILTLFATPTHAQEPPTEAPTAEPPTNSTATVTGCGVLVV